MLEVEFDEHLGYKRYDNKNKSTSTQYIASHLKSIFGIDIDYTLVDKITYRVLPLG